MAVPETCRAAVFSGPGRPLRIESFPLPGRLEAEELLVAVDCCTICGSDLHTWRGRRSAPPRVVLGHEVVGRVAALPPAGRRDLDGDPLAVGDRVTWSIFACCTRCFFCRQGLPQKCERLLKYGHEAAGSGQAPSGGLAEYCHLRAGTAVLRLPPSLSDEAACPANCATATAAAACRAAQLGGGETVIVQGAGMVGLTAAALAVWLGAGHVLVTDIAPQRRRLAEACGLPRALDAADRDALLRWTDEASDGRGADVVLECSGAAAAVEQSVSLLRMGGRLLLVGSVSPGPAVQLDPEQLVRRLLRVEGVHNYTPADLRQAVEFLAAAPFPAASLVAASYSLDDAQQAFAHAERPEAVRVAVRPGGVSGVRG